ncbi:hypothetical protein LTR56_017908 [Elasticomyces elasticus]|nr:hypothetical protein LTR56_017908 [Elasticomyces elasticus]KAK4907583.1 hypothetical protein LTR49_023394 [Elasticomyces elasticus]
MLPFPVPRIENHAGRAPRPLYRHGYPSEGGLVYGHYGFRFQYNDQKLWEPPALQERLTKATEAGKWISKNWVAAQLSFYQIPYEYTDTGKQLQVKLMQAAEEGLAQCDEVPDETYAIEERLKAAYIPLWNDYVTQLIAWEDLEIQKSREARARNGIPERPEEDRQRVRNVRARYR